MASHRNEYNQPGLMRRRARQGQPVANPFREFVIRQMLNGGEGERKKRRDGGREERGESVRGKKASNQDEPKRTEAKKHTRIQFQMKNPPPDSAIAIIKAGSRRKKAAKWRTAHRGTLDQRACLVVVSGPVFLDSLVDLVPVGLGLFVVLFALNLRDWQWGG